MQVKKIIVLCVLFYTFQVGAASDNKTVTLNFVNADIESVVKAIGKITGKNFLLDPRVKGTVNIVSSRPVSRELSYQILLSSLRLQGFTAVEEGGIVKIVPEADAKFHAKNIKPRRKIEGDRLITKVFVLQYGNATQLLPVLRPLITPNNMISTYPQSNALIVTDYAENIQRIESIIDSVESASLGDTAVIPLLYSSAMDIAATINKLQKESGSITDVSKVAVIPDARANVLMVKADTPGKIGKIKSLVALLDQPNQAGSNIRVVYLRNSEASQMAQVLRSLLMGRAGPLQGRIPVTTNDGSSPGSAFSNNSSASSSLGGLGSMGSSSPTPGVTPQMAGRSINSNNAGTVSGAGDDNGGDSSVSMIQADPTNNALILNMPDTMYQNIRNVIELLDKRRAQVLVEALVVEVSAQRALELGVQWQNLGGLNGKGFIGGTSFIQPAQGALNPALIPLDKGTTLNSFLNAGGLNFGWVDGIINVPGVGAVLNMKALAHALETEAGANIISSPSLLALDNEKAQIQVGQEVPILTGQYANTGGGSTPQTPFSTYDRKTIGFNLEITPQVSEGGTIRLKIIQEASSIVPGTETNPAGPITNRRLIETIANVQDGGILAIGGLIQDSVSNDTNKVPILGDIPGLGVLFRYTSKKHDKTNLLIFLRPTLLRDSVGADAIAGDRYNYIVGEANKVGKEKLPFTARTAFDSLPPNGIRSSLEKTLGTVPLLDAPSNAPIIPLRRPLPAKHCEKGEDCTPLTPAGKQ